MGQTITRIYDAYLAAVKKGTFREVSAFFSQELKKEIKTSNDEYMMMVKLMAPASCQPIFRTMTNGG